jgi:hypothetical protein
LDVSHALVLLSWMLSFPTLELDVSHALVLLSWMLSLMRDFNNKEKKNEMQL